MFRFFGGRASYGFLCAFFLVSCAPGGDSEELAGGPLVKPGFFAIDGTGNTLKNRSNIVQMFENWKGAQKQYFPGVTDHAFASDLGARRDQVMSAICKAVTSSKVKDVFIAGYSRGAVIASDVANRLVAGNGCKGARVRWVGLFDKVSGPVGAIIEWAGRWNLFRGIRQTGGDGLAMEVPAGVPIFHIRRRDFWTNKADPADAMATVQLQGKGNVTEKKAARTHAEIGWWGACMDQVVESARRAGGLFPALNSLKRDNRKGPC